MSHRNSFHNGSGYIRSHSYCMESSNETSASRRNGSSYDAFTGAFEIAGGSLCCVGVVTNSFLLAILISSPVLRRGVGVILGHLFISHFILCFLVLPMAIYGVAKSVSNPETEDCEFCRILLPLHMFFNTVVNWTEAILACGRLVAILFPLQFLVFSQSFVQMGLLVLCWASSAVIAIPPAYGILATVKMTALGTCAYADRSPILVILLAFNGYCPLVFITTAAVVITVKVVLLNSSRRVHRIPAVVVTPFGTMSGQDSEKRLSRTGLPEAQAVLVGGGMTDRQKRTSKTLLAAFLFSLTCQLPLYIFGMTGLSSKYPKMILCFWILSVLQYAVTPVIFLTMNQDYKGIAIKWLRPGAVE